MEGKHQRKRTFQNMVHEVADRNVGRLMSKAIIANRLAKTLTGLGRRAAYRVKTEMLTGLAQRFPEQVTVEPDHTRPDLLVVSVLSRNFGLHVPEELFPVHRDSSSRFSHFAEGRQG